MDNIILILSAAVMLLAVVAALFCVLFLKQRKNIREARRQMEFIYDNPDINLQLKLAVPDRNTEKLLACFNRYIDLFQRKNISYKKQEKKLRQEMANISHDLRTPLTSILGYMDILEKDMVTGEERAEYIAVVNRKAEIMKNIVESFYELSTAEADDYKIFREEILMYDLMCDTLLAFQNDFESRNIEVRLDLQENAGTLMTDRHIAIRVISNLIQNALRYAKSWTEISMKRVGGDIIVTFSNDTDGITEADIEHIFERTYTADKARTKGQMGLGLAISKKLMEMQHGNIDAGITEGVFRIIVTFKGEDFL